MTSDDQLMQDTVVLAAEPCARSKLQSCDIILNEFPTPEAGWRWAVTVLANYPGCLVAVAHDPDRRWCLHNIRGFGGLFVRARDTPLDQATIHAMARLSYQDIVLARTDRLQADIEAHGCMVVVRTPPTDDPQAP